MGTPVISTYIKRNMTVLRILSRYIMIALLWFGINYFQTCFCPALKSHIHWGHCNMIRFTEVITGNMDYAVLPNDSELTTRKNHGWHYKEYGWCEFCAHQFVGWFIINTLYSSCQIIFLITTINITVIIVPHSTKIHIYLCLSHDIKYLFVGRNFD